MAQGIPARLSAAEGRKFGLTVGLAFLSLAGIAWWRGRAPLALGLGAVGGALTLAGLVRPTALGPVQRGWMGMARGISKVTTPIVMGIVYFGLLAPVGLLMRAVGRTPLVRRESEGSFWISRAAGRRSGGMEHQF